MPPSLTAGPSLVVDARADGGDGPAGAGATSLVQCRESVGGICPKKPMFMVCDQDRSIRHPASCDAYRCEVCGPGKARQRAALMTWALRRAGRGRLVTLTLLPTLEDGSLDWQRARGQLREFTYRLRHAGYAVEWAWAVEQNPRGTGYHVHLVMWGDYIPQRELAAMWGNRRVDIRAIRRPADGLYAMKDAVKVAGYAVKHGTDDFGGLSKHLDINGGRAVHMSRGFLHGLTAREALREVALEQGGDEERTWHLEPAWVVDNEEVAS